MKKLSFGVIAAALVLASTAHAAPKKTDDPACPYKVGGICYSKPGAKTGCNGLDKVTFGKETYCKLGPANNPKPVPTLKEPARIQGRDG